MTSGNLLTLYFHFLNYKNEGVIAALTQDKMIMSIKYLEQRLVYCKHSCLFLMNIGQGFGHRRKERVGTRQWRALKLPSGARGAGRAGALEALRSETPRTGRLRWAAWDGELKMNAD